MYKSRFSKQISKTDKEIARRTANVAIQAAISTIHELSDELKDVLGLLKNTHTKYELNTFSEYEICKALNRHTSAALRDVNNILDPIRHLLKASEKNEKI